MQIIEKPRLNENYDYIIESTILCAVSKHFKIHKYVFRKRKFCTFAVLELSSSYLSSSLGKF